VAVPAVAAPPPAPPDMTGLEVPLLVSPVESVGRPPEQREWAQYEAGTPPPPSVQPRALPPPPAPTQPAQLAAPAPVAVAAAEPARRRAPTYAPSFEPQSPPAAKLTRKDELPTDQEGIFMKRALAAF